MYFEGQFFRGVGRPGLSSDVFFCWAGMLNLARLSDNLVVERVRVLGLKMKPFLSVWQVQITRSVSQRRRVKSALSMRPSHALTTNQRPMASELDSTS
jgi:hypothetical protein